MQYIWHVITNRSVATILRIYKNRFTNKPQIVSLTEINYKNRDVIYQVHELSISGYIERKGERGVAMYVSSDLDSIFLELASQGPEFVFIKVEIKSWTC